MKHQPSPLATMTTPPRTDGRLSTLLVALLAAGALGHRPAGQVAAEQALPTAREVIDRHAAACNLRETLTQVGSMHLKGKFSLAGMGVEGAAEIWSAKPNLRRTSMEMGAFGTMLGGYDGSVAWMTHPMVGARIPKGTEFLQSQIEADWTAALKEGEAYESLRTVGRESFEGKECWKVEVVVRALPDMDAEKTREARKSFEFYEIEGGLLAGTKGQQESDLGSGPYTQIFSEYKPFGSQRVAARTVLRQASQEVVLTIDSVEYDTVAADFFRPPPEIQKMLAPKPAPVTPQ